MKNYRAGDRPGNHEIFLDRLHDWILQKILSYCGDDLQSLNNLFFLGGRYRRMIKDKIYAYSSPVMGGGHYTNHLFFKSPFRQPKNIPAWNSGNVDLHGKVYNQFNPMFSTEINTDTIKYRETYRIKDHKQALKDMVAERDVIFTDFIDPNDGQKLAKNPYKYNPDDQVSHICMYNPVGLHHLDSTPCSAGQEEVEKLRGNISDQQLETMKRLLTPIRKEETETSIDRVTTVLDPTNGMSYQDYLEHRRLPDIPNNLGETILSFYHKPTNEENLARSVLSRDRDLVDPEYQNHDPMIPSISSYTTMWED